MAVTARPQEAIARRRRAGLVIAVTATVAFVLVAVGIGTVFLRPQLFIDAPAPTVATDVERLEVGDLVPTISGENFDGQRVVIDEGEARILLFAAHWCDHCKAELEMLAEARGAGTLDLNVPLVVISTRHIPGVRWPPADALDLEGGPDEVLVDSDSSLAGLFDVQSVPRWFFLDEDGRIVADETGELSLADIRKYVADAVSPK